MTTTAMPVVESGRAVNLFGDTYPVVLPSLRDPRSHVAAVLISVQVFGQTVLQFNLSIAQILLSVLLCAAIEIPMTMWDRGTLAWPASALLTGNGIALLLRTPGTEHGDWWSLNGWPVFVAAASIAVLSKYAIRIGRRHVFNPSNLGLVVVFLVFGAKWADPQELWWGPWRPGLVATVLLILAGGITLSLRVGLLDIVVSFWATFAAGIAVVALAGHAMVARWSLTPVEGLDYWSILVTSPEIIIFAFFMITDPPTTPDSRRARIVYSIGIGALAALLSATQTTEFGTKVSLLAALTVLCALRPMLESRLPDPVVGADGRRTRWPRLLRPVPLAGLTVAWVGLMVLSTNLVSDTLEPGVDQGTVVSFDAAGDRPAVETPGSLPTPEVRDNVAREANVDTAVATRVLEDVAADLAILSEALRKGDPEIARTASFGTHLTSTTERIDTNAAAGRSEEVLHTYDSAELVLLRDPISPQSVPQLGLFLTGTREDVSYSDPSGGQIDSRSTGEFEQVFLVTDVDGHWLIGDEMDPTDPMVTA